MPEKFEADDSRQFQGAPGQHDEEVTIFRKQVAEFQTELNAERGRAAQLELDADALRNQLRAIQISTTWRLTGPIRRLGVLLPRLHRFVSAGVKAVLWTAAFGYRVISRLRKLLHEGSGAKSSEPTGAFRIDSQRFKHWEVSRGETTRSETRHETNFSDNGDFDVFADLTNATEAAFDDLLQRCHLSEQAKQITCVVGPNLIAIADAKKYGVRLFPTEKVVTAFADAIESARLERRHLLVSIGGVIDLDVIARLMSALDADPLIGFSQPRFAHPDGYGMMPLPSPDTKKSLSSYSYDILQHLPAFQLVPEFVAASVLIRGQLVANFPTIDRRLSTVAAALYQLMTWSRRRGYRVAIVNHAVSKILTSQVAYPAPSFGERALLRKQYPDLARAEVEFANLRCHRREALLALGLSSLPAEQQRLLLDCRGMQPGFNGTTECVLGLLKGLSLLETGWSITVLTSGAAVSFHKLQERYPRFNIVGDLPDGLYTVAIRLSQPWKLQDLIDLHSRALLVAVNMLDTIAWDIMMTGVDVESLWSFVARYLDGIIFISKFTRDRFNFRFPVAAKVREAVTYLSFRSDDYRGGKTDAGANTGSILLVGNDLPHKGIAQAIEYLADAFPHECFVVIGPSSATSPNVRYFASGAISEAAIDQLFVDAKMLIYPTFYEGFGFPVVKGLAFSLDVVARRSTLLTELSQHCEPKGRVVPFDDPHSLVGAVGRILAGEPVETLPLGGAIEEGAEPLNWRDVASQMMNFVEGLTVEISAQQYDAREEILRFFR